MSKKWVSLLICIIFIFTSLSISSEGKLNIFNDLCNIKTSSHIIININNAPTVASILLSEGFDILYDTITKTSFEL